MIEFGRYPQEDAAADQPIAWHVLDGGADGPLLLSARILDCRRYHDEAGETTWRDSTMRQWLNDAFLSRAFDRDERKSISENRCRDNGDGAPATVDRVFLLSGREIRDLTQAGDGRGLDRRAVATPFARQKTDDGCRLYVYDKTVDRDYLDVDGERRGCSWWWLRSQPQAQDGTASRAAFIGARGDVKTYGLVDTPYYGVRPAIRVRNQL